MTLPQLFATILAVFALAMMLMYIRNLGSRPSYEMDFMSRDLALFLDAVPAVPQQNANFYAIYIQPNGFLNNYSFHFYQNKVEVSKKEAKTAFFTPMPGLAVSEKDMPYDTERIVVRIFKHGSKVLFDDGRKPSITYNPNLLSCAGAPYTKKFNVIAVHDPTQGQAGAVENNIRSALEGMGLVNPPGISTDPSVPRLTLLLDDAPKDNIVVKAYVNGNSKPDELEQETRAACELVNSVLKVLSSKNIEVSGAAVVPVDPAQTASSADDSLVADRGDILLEFGTTQLSEFIIPEFQIDFAKALQEGLAHAKS